MELNLQGTLPLVLLSILRQLRNGTEQKGERDHEIGCMYDFLASPFSLPDGKRRGLFSTPLAGSCAIGP